MMTQLIDTENDVWAWVANCLYVDARVMLVFISRVEKHEGGKH